MFLTSEHTLGTLSKWLDFYNKSNILKWAGALTLILSSPRSYFSPKSPVPNFGWSSIPKWKSHPCPSCHFFLYYSYDDNKSFASYFRHFWTCNPLSLIWTVGGITYRRHKKKYKVMVWILSWGIQNTASLPYHFEKQARGPDFKYFCIERPIVNTMSYFPSYLYSINTIRQVFTLLVFWPRQNRGDKNLAGGGGKLKVDFEWFKTVLPTLDLKNERFRESPSQAGKFSGFPIQNYRFYEENQQKSRPNRENFLGAFGADPAITRGGVKTWRGGKSDELCWWVTVKWYTI